MFQSYYDTTDIARRTDDEGWYMVMGRAADVITAGELSEIVCFCDNFNRQDKICRKDFLRL